MAERRLAGRTAVVEAWLARNGDPEGEARRLAAVHPLGRIAKAREVARAVVWLASDDASAVTGTEIAVDSGLSAKHAGQEV